MVKFIRVDKEGVEETILWTKIGSMGAEDEFIQQPVQYPFP